MFLINGIPVLVIECKNANKDEAIALGVDQIRRYHRETPELFVSEQVFTATDAIGFSYGMTWNTVRRNIFNWKLSEPQISQMGADMGNQEKYLRKSASSAVKYSDLPGRLEVKVKSFCAIAQVLAFIIVTMIHKFRDMPANLNTRSNIYVLIDEARRTTGGDLGNYLMAGLPNASYIGFTGTPVDKTVYGRGTFKTFGCEDDQGYLQRIQSN